ncbi:MAG: hypothetical protein RR620_00870 [Clostridium sp.]
MKKGKILVFTKSLFVLFIICTIVSFIIVYNNIDSRIAFNFLIAYLALSFFMLVYVPTMIIVKSRNLTWIDVRKRIVKLCVVFITFSSSSYIFDLVFRSSNIDLVRNLTIALGLSVGLSFIDIILLKKK